LSRNLRLHSSLNSNKDEKVNEPNMIVDPDMYLDRDKKTFDHISDNIMKEHLAYEEIAQNKEKMRQKR